jgi:putative membrane protein
VSALVIQTPPLAHLGPHGEGIPRSEIWTHWNLAPEILIPLALAPLAYAAVLRRLRSEGAARSLRPRHAVSFAIGWLALAVALVSPLDAGASRHLLAAHMAQHMLLIAIAAPLLAYGLPLARMPALLGRRGRAALARLRRGLAGSLPSIAIVAVLALLVHVAVVWAWHLPAPYEAALASGPLHAAQHAFFLGTALLLWWALLDFGAATRPSLVMALALFALAAQGAALGALIAFSGGAWYAPYAESATAAGADPLADQQLAGLLMWGLGSIAPAGLAVALLIGWLTRMDRYPAAAGIRPQPRSRPTVID